MEFKRWTQKVLYLRVFCLSLKRAAVLPAVVKRNFVACFKLIKGQA